MTDLFEGKLILTDLDGTLLDERDEISEENRRAVDRFIEGGGLFSVATGRSKMGMEHFFPRLRINAPAVLYNGAAIYDFAAGREIDSAPVGESGARLAARLIRTFPELGVEVYSGHVPYVAQGNDYSRRHFASVKTPWNPCPPEAIPQPWLSLVLTGENGLLRAAEDVIRNGFPDAFFLQYSSPHMLEVLRKDANKGAGALRLAKLLGVGPEGLFTVGDGTNDVQLLACAFHSCAPENACPRILAAARHRLPHHKDHAIAALIERLAKGEYA